MVENGNPITIDRLDYSTAQTIYEKLVEVTSKVSNTSSVEVKLVDTDEIVVWDNRKASQYHAALNAVPLPLPLLIEDALLFGDF